MRRAECRARCRLQRAWRPSSPWPDPGRHLQGTPICPGATTGDRRPTVPAIRVSSKPIWVYSKPGVLEATTVKLKDFAAGARAQCA